MESNEDAKQHVAIRSLPRVLLCDIFTFYFDTPGLQTLYGMYQEHGLWLMILLQHMHSRAINYDLDHHRESNCLLHACCDGDIRLINYLKHILTPDVLHKGFIDAFSVACQRGYLVAVQYLANNVLTVEEKRSRNNRLKLMNRRGHAS